MKIDHQTHALLIRFVLAMLALSYLASIAFGLAGVDLPAQIAKIPELGWPALLGLALNPKEAQAEASEAQDGDAGTEGNDAN